jgi:hypothetical protein
LLKLNYHVINKNHTAEEYDTLIKNEITKIYNEFKSKKIINNGMFATQKPVKEYIDITFIYKDASIYSDYIGIFKLVYDEKMDLKNLMKR